MSKEEPQKLPKIVQKKSKAMRLDPGVYYYCRCGLSDTQPWCDGKHQGTDFQPKKLVIDMPQEVYLCMCKHTLKSPFCDGSHRKI